MTRRCATWTASAPDTGSSDRGKSDRTWLTCCSRLKLLCQALVRSACQRCPAWIGALSPFTGDFPGHATGRQFDADLARVVTCVEVDRDVVRERADLVEFVQRGGQQPESCRFAGASTRPSGMPFPSTMLERFMPGWPRSTGLRPAHSPPGAFVMHPSTAMSRWTRPAMRSGRLGWHGYRSCVEAPTVRVRMPSALESPGRPSWPALSPPRPFPRW